MTPIASFLALAWVFSIGFVIAGLSEIIYSIANRKELRSWGWYLTGGILTFLIGFHLSLRPELTALVLCYYIAFWLLFRSIMQIGNAFEIKDIGIKNWGWVFVFGLLGVVAALILLWNPVITSITVIYWLSFGILSYGILQIVLAFEFRKLKVKIENIKDGVREFLSR
ncbi:MAG: DUF308 domain-containing protein [Chitinophagaceae bacterium]|nr:DUF308 domain-containing protein [Chitinophagaceae bacterium]